MAVSLKHTTVAVGTNSGNGEIAKEEWNEEHTLTLATDRLLGRATAGAGAVEEITCTAAGRALIDDADAAAQRTTLGLADALLSSVTATITKGYAVTPHNLGTISSGTTTLDPANGNYQYYTNNGAHTIAAPASDCAIDILVTNGSSAGSITFSGFTVGSSTGSAYNITNTNKFILSVRRINAVSTYSWYALQ